MTGLTAAGTLDTPEQFAAAHSRQRITGGTIFALPGLGLANTVSTPLPSYLAPVAFSNLEALSAEFSPQGGLLRTVGSEDFDNLGRSILTASLPPRHISCDAAHQRCGCAMM